MLNVVFDMTDSKMEGQQRNRESWTVMLLETGEPTKLSERLK